MPSHPIRRTDRDLCTRPTRLGARACRAQAAALAFDDREDSMTFESLGLPEPVTRALADAGYDAPTTVQPRPFRRRSPAPT